MCCFDRKEALLEASFPFRKEGTEKEPASPCFKEGAAQFHLEVSYQA